MFAPMIIGTACSGGMTVVVIEMMMDVNVELLWTNTVPIMPIMSPTMGLERKPPSSERKPPMEMIFDDQYSHVQIFKSKL